jgi:hypothetical protein
MDRITQIEEGLKAVLEGIDGSTVGDYTYLSTIKSVYFEQDDEVTSVTKSSSNRFPTVTIKQEPGETVNSGESKAYQNEIFYTLCFKVSLGTPSSNPRQALKVKMNEVLQDLKFAIYNDYHLNDTCDEAHVLSSSREYYSDGKTLRNGQINVRIRIEYTQSRSNPAINVCA